MSEENKVTTVHNPAMPVHAHHTYKVPCINNTQHIQKPAPPAGQPPSRQAETRRGARNGERQTEQGRGKPHNSSKNQKKGSNTQRGYDRTRESKPKSINLMARDPPPPRPRTRSWGGGLLALALRVCVCVIYRISHGRVSEPRAFISREIHSEAE